MSSPEESFVILGTTPTPSMELIGNSIASNDLASALLERSTRTLSDNVCVDPWKKEIPTSSMNQLNSINVSINREQPFSMLQITNGESSGTNMVTSETKNMHNSNENNMFASTSSNLAESIILGKIEANTIKVRKL